MAEKREFKNNQNVKNCWNAKNYTRENNHFYSTLEGTVQLLWQELPHMQ